MGNGTGIPWDFCPGTQIPGIWTAIGTHSLGTLWTRTNITGKVPGQKSLGQPNSCFFKTFKISGTGSITQVPSSSKVVPWEAKPRNSWDWVKNRWDSPEISSFGTQVPGTKIVGTCSPVQCPSLILNKHKTPYNVPLKVSLEFMDYSI